MANIDPRMVKWEEEPKASIDPRMVVWVEEKPKQKPPKPSTTMDVVKSVASAVPKAASNIVGLPSTVIDLIGAGADKVGGFFGLPAGTFKPEMANAGDVARRGFDQMGLIHQPQTGLGRYAGAAVEGALTAPTTGLMALSGVGAGVGTEAGRDLTGGSPWGGLAGGFLLGVTPNAVAGLRNRAAERVAEATKNMTPADWDAAVARQKAAQALGIQVTGPEAIGNKNLLSQQLLLENSPRTSQQFEEVMRQRPGQVSAAVTRELDAIGPVPVDPMAVGARVQGASQVSIDAARQAGNARAAPFYAEADAARIPALDWNRMLQENPMLEKALKAVKGNPQYGVPASAPEGSVLWLDAAKKYLDDLVGSAKQAGTPGAARVPGAVADDIRSTVDSTVPAYRDARQIVQQNVRNVVEPMEQGLPGKLASTSDPVTQFRSLVDPQRVTVETVKRAAISVKMKDPAAYRDLVRQGLQNEFDESMKMLQTGGQEFAGARLVRSLRETPQTRANIEEMLRQLPDGNIRVRAFNNLLDTLEVTGNRLPVGSRTAFNQLQLDDMSAQGLTRIATNPVGGVAGWWDRLSARMTGDELAKVFTDKDSVKKLREMAFTKPGTAKARALAASLISAEMSEE